MNRHYQYTSGIFMIAIMAIATTAISPAWAQSTQPSKGDADRLRPAQGQPILPTNADEFSPSSDLPNSNLKIQSSNLEIGVIKPVLSGDYNASPQKVNNLGSFSSDPLHAVQIFQNSGSTSREQ